MPLSWNEIKDRALAFSKEWGDEESEDAEAKSFWDAFFHVFGITRRRVASFERPVKKGDGRGGFIDLLWKGVLLVEHKSRGKDLDGAYAQALHYFPGLKERDLPRYVVVSDFARFRLYDLDRDRIHEFVLEDLYENVHLFGFIAGYETRSYGDQQDPVNIKAALRLGKLHDELEAVGYVGHELRVLLVRLLFCMFAEDTSIFDKGQFQEFIELRTSEDGSDLGLHLAGLFQELNRPTTKRMRTLDELVAAFPYVNGKLFAEPLPMASFNGKMREAILDACATVNWSQISPAIFGSLFQSIMDRVERRNLGAHYTTETNIRKALDPLFLDELRDELEKAKGSRSRLSQFLDKLPTIRVLDPACGCGNFLVVAYRELRRLELEALKALLKTGQQVLDTKLYIKVNVDQFFGIEIEEFPAQIAQVALWLTDHQENLRVSEALGQYFVRLPLTSAPTIVNANALDLDWNSVVPASKVSYVVGNPPFVGKKEQSASQKADLAAVWDGVPGTGILDYVTCWYRKAAEYLYGTNVPCAFVSTNSITQGEQVGVLWDHMFQRWKAKINFAHRPFPWMSEARGKAHVHVVIIGFTVGNTAPQAQTFPRNKRIFEQVGTDEHTKLELVTNINPYLVEGGDRCLRNRTTPINGGPAMSYGSMMIDKDRKAGDDQGLLLTKEYRDLLLGDCPDLEPYIRECFGGDEYLKGTVKWCLWLVGAPPELIRSSRLLRDRVEKIRQFRLGSNRPQTRKLASTPALFGEIRQPDEDYLLVPKVSSENRRYIPVGFMPPDVIATGSALIVPGAMDYDFAVLSSTMHNAWMRVVAGRLESRLQYSSNIVYNNFPWPEPTEAQRKKVAAFGRTVLNVRERWPNATPSDLYDPASMPPELAQAHQKLDRAVDLCYRKEPFTGDADRVTHLFNIWQRLAAPLLRGEQQRTRRSKASL